MIKEDEEQRTFTLVCVLDQKGFEAPQLQTTNPCLLSPVPPPPSSSSVAPQSPLEPPLYFNLASFASLISECLNEATWARPSASMQETFTFTRKNLSLKLISGVGDCGPSKGQTDLHVNDENLPNIGEPSPGWPCAHGSNNSKDVPETLAGTGSLTMRRHKHLVKSCSDPGALGRDKMVKQRKSVSFEDEVMVYLFDQVPLACLLSVWLLLALVSCHSRPRPAKQQNEAPLNRRRRSNASCLPFLTASRRSQR